MKKSFLIAIIVLLACMHSVLAISIGISPGRVRFDNVLEDGYAERSITITTNSEETLFGHFDVNGDIEGWVRFEPESNIFNASISSPYKLMIIIEPPSDLPSGNYSGSIDFITDTVGSLDGRAGGVVKAAVTLLMNAQVTKDQIIDCRAGAFFLGDTEEGFPIDFGATIINDGNVRLQPTLVLDVWDQNQEKLVLTHEVQTEIVQPTTQRRISRSIDQNLPLGQYWAKLLIKECKQDQLLTMNILEKGAIVDSGILNGIYGKTDAMVGETVEFIAKFENQGPRAVSAKFKGNVRLDDTIVKIIETDEILVDPGNLADFNIFFTPQEKGKYSLQGRVIYNKKLTYEKGSTLSVEVEGAQDKTFNFIALLIYLIIIVTIFFIFRKILKERKKRKT